MRVSSPTQPPFNKECRSPSAKNKKEKAAQGFGIFHPPAANEIPGKPGGFLTLSGRSLNFSTLKAKTAFAYNAHYSHLPLPHPFATPFGLDITIVMLTFSFLFFTQDSLPIFNPQFRRPPVLGVCG